MGDWVKRRSEGLRIAIVVLTPAFGATILFFGIEFIFSQLWPEIFFEPINTPIGLLKATIIFLGGFLFLFLVPAFYGMEKLREYILGSEEEAEED